MYYWDDIIGNNQIKNILERTAKKGEFSHAYMINGPKGSGKKLLANTFAKSIFCGTKEKGCICHSCVQFNAAGHSDLVHLRPEKTKSIGVDILRSRIINDINKKPFEYQYKIYIIEEAHMMTPQAQNALLRSLEEPPEYVIFILLSNNIYSFLPTIISRCFILNIKPLSTEAVYGYFKNGGDKAKIAAEYSGGSIGAAISIYENDEFFEMRNIINKGLSAIVATKDLGLIFDEVRKFEAYKDNPDDFITIALMWFRDVLVLKATGGLSFIPGDSGELMKSAKEASFKSLYLKIQYIKELKRSITANTGFITALDAMAVKFKLS